jgi:hypothetical protein
MSQVVDHFDFRQITKHAPPNLSLFSYFSSDNEGTVPSATTEPPAVNQEAQLSAFVER